MNSSINICKMGKWVSNRNKFILGRVLLVIGAALIVPLIIIFTYVATNGSDVWWNIKAVHISASINNITIVSRKYIELCNSDCTGDCANCEVNYFNAYITAAYLTYEYRYLLYGKVYHTLDYVENGLKKYKINNTIILYYNPSNPRDASLNFRDYKGDILCFLMAILMFVLFSVLTLTICLPRRSDVPKENEDLEASTVSVNKVTSDIPIITIDDKGNEYTAVSRDNIELEPVYLFDRSGKIIK